MFCSEECQRRHYQLGHKYACPHIKAVHSGNSPLGDLSVFDDALTTNEDTDGETPDASAVIPAIASMKIKEMKEELREY